MGSADKHTMTRLEMVGRLSSLCFNYDNFASALARVQEFHALSKVTPAANFMLLYGATGVGKTTIIQQLCKRIEQDEEAEDARSSVIYLQVPASCTPKALATELLVALGDPAADRGTMSNMTRRVIKYLNKLQISLVILDEFQHLIETKSEKVLYATADWLKSVTNEVQSSFLLSGLPTVEDVIAANPQLKRRVMSRFVLRPLPLDNDQDLKRVQTLLGLFSRELSFENASVIASESFAKSIYVASDGAIGRIVNILKLTCLNALRDDTTQLEKHHFQEAVSELGNGRPDGAAAPIPNAFAVL